MKYLSVRMLSLSAVLLFIISSCKKDKSTLEDYVSPFNYRIISEVWYENDQFSEEFTYEYSGSRLTKISSLSDWIKMNFQYPDNNKITFDYHESDGLDNTYVISGQITLSDNKVTEINMDEEGKVTYNYNSEGKISKIRYYDPGSSVYYEEDVFTYNSGKLIQIIISYLDEEPPNDFRYVYTYNGNEHNEQFYSHRVSGGPWEEWGKSGYTSKDGKISKITDYNYYNSEYTEQGNEEYSYDNFGNLIETVENWNSTQTFRIEYTYEEEGGNYRQIFDYLEGVGCEIDYDPSFAPKPNKSQSNGQHNLNSHFPAPLNLLIKKHF
jgi:YD repeat-containing protein